MVAAPTESSAERSETALTAARSSVSAPRPGGRRDSLTRRSGRASTPATRASMARATSPSRAGVGAHLDALEGRAARSAGQGDAARPGHARQPRHGRQLGDREDGPARRPAGAR